MDAIRPDGLDWKEAEKIIQRVELYMYGDTVTGEYPCDIVQMRASVASSTASRPSVSRATSSASVSESPSTGWLSWCSSTVMRCFSRCCVAEYSLSNRAKRVCNMSRDDSSRSTFSSVSSLPIPMAPSASSSSRPSFVRISRPLSSNTFLAAGYSVTASIRSSLERQKRSE
ncbi:hypothetical protein CRUP_011459 [Coryphaenoides rupestris]|nr:hypothetical protein CRUP_011459 [Coryphaenoides rupestris]